MKRLSKVLIAFIIITTALIEIPNSAHAAPSVVQTKQVTGAAVTSLSATFNSGVTFNDLIVVVINGEITAGSCATINTPTDSFGSTFTLAVNRAASATNCAINAIYYGKSIYVGSETITDTFSASVTNAALSIYQLAGVDSSTPAVNTGSGICTAACGTTLTTFSTSFVNGAIAIGGEAVDIASTFTAGTSYTMLNGAAGAFGNSEYSTTVTTPTTFSATVTGAVTVWSDIGVTFNALPIPIQILKDSYKFIEVCSAGGGPGQPPFCGPLILAQILVTIIEQTCTSPGPGVITCSPGFLFKDFITKVTISLAAVATQTITYTVTATVALLSCTGTQCYVATDSIQSFFWSAIIAPGLVILAPLLILFAMRIKNEGIILGVLALVTLIMGVKGLLPVWTIFLTMIFAAGSVSFLVVRFLGGSKGVEA